MGISPAIAISILADLAAFWPAAADDWQSRAMALTGGAVALAVVVCVMLIVLLRQRRCFTQTRGQVQQLREALLRLSEGEHLHWQPVATAHPMCSDLQAIQGAVIQCRERWEQLKAGRRSLDIRSRRAVARAARAEAVLSGLSEPVLVVDDFGDLVLANREAEKLFGFKFDPTEPVSLERLLTNKKVVELIRAAVKRKTARGRTDEIAITDTEGEQRWFRLTTNRLALDEPAGENEDSGGMIGSGGGAVAMLHDISDRRELQKRNAEFVSSVSHEMRTPLTSIGAYVELLSSGEADDEETRAEFLGTIASQTQRLTRLVENLLNLARIEAGVVSVNKQNLSLNEVLEEAAGVIGPQAEAKEIKIDFDLSPMYLGVLADRDMLLQTAINLLSNAVKYTNVGGQVTLRSRMVDDHVRFEVKDNGVGLSQEDCQRVFDKFYRVKANQNMAIGTGLGLPLAKHIVEDVHGGELTVESVEGSGSTFAATIPGAGQMS